MNTKNTNNRWKLFQRYSKGNLPIFGVAVLLILSGVWTFTATVHSSLPKPTDNLSATVQPLDTSLDQNNPVCPCQLDDLVQSDGGSCAIPLVPGGCYVMRNPPSFPADDEEPSPLRLLADLPSEFSWKNYNDQDWTTPAKDQGSCGSCWDFAAVGVLESKINIVLGNPGLDLDLSEQYVLSCLPKTGDCLNGNPGQGIPHNVFKYIKDSGPDGNYCNGIPLESSLPYMVSNQIPCTDKTPDWNHVLVPISGYGYIKNSSTTPLTIETIKSALISKGPVVTLFDATPMFAVWGVSHHNESDVYYTPEQPTVPYTHAVMIVGYKDDPSIPSGGYWICKNCWDTNWGYDGFFNIAYGCKNIDSYYIAWVDYTPTPLPVVQFSLTPIFPQVGEIIQFTDTSYDLLGPGTISSWHWDFGDGYNSTTQHPQHTYTAEGRYQVTLTIIDEQNHTDSFYQSLRINDPGILYSGGTGPGNYTTIQDAINHSYDRDTVYVYPGTYTEHIRITKGIHLVGADQQTTIITAGNGIAIDCAADYTTVEGFTTYNVYNPSHIDRIDCLGIRVLADNVTISGNTVKAADLGVVIMGSHTNLSQNTIDSNSLGVSGGPLRESDNTICKNRINNCGTGISFSDAFTKNTISGNTLSNNRIGISLSTTKNLNLISDNIIENNVEAGISLSDSMNSIISYNSIFYNTNGISLSISRDNIISRNIIVNNIKSGIYLYPSPFDSSRNLITDNIILSNTDGINASYASSANMICRNMISLNNRYGLYIASSTANTIYHNNVVNNTQNVYESTSNQWDDGYPSGGNFWSDYTGVDANGDGIGDTPYIIRGENKDQYPLMHLFFLGDMNRDGIVNNQDIDLFDFALFHTETEFTAMYPSGYYYAADMNSDGVVNNQDIDGFNALLFPEGNLPPFTPGKPLGPTQGDITQVYSFSACTLDPDICYYDLLWYNFSWGDGDYTGWIGPYAFCVSAQVSHSWTAPGTYQIKVRAKDSHDAESSWSAPLQVKIVGLGDMDRDGAVNGQDIDLFVYALFHNESEFLVMYPLGNYEAGDMNSDGAVNGQDIDQFYHLLFGE
jgi:parallel beta-helix repeat protein